jgi:leader peptidase (prepilin peptidase) / N-methyltransferase
MEVLVLALTLLLVFMLGASVGSFLNVVIYRVPAGLSVLHPPSRCPSCLRSLKAYDNVPVLGWLWLKGRCRYCKTRIAARYPLVEAATGLLFVLVFWIFDLSIPTLGYWFFLSWLLALALIDLDTLTLPNALTQSGLIAGLVFQAVLGGWDGSGTSVARGLMTGVIGAVLGIWLFDLITIGASVAFGQTAMGGGDAKLAAMMGAWLGWQLLLLASFLACLLGALVGGGAMALGFISRRQPIPFGPFLALGAALAALFGPNLIAGYLHLFFPVQ